MSKKLSKKEWKKWEKQERKRGWKNPGVTEDFITWSPIQKVVGKHLRSLGCKVRHQEWYTTVRSPDRSICVCIYYYHDKVGVVSNGQTIYGLHEHEILYCQPDFIDRIELIVLSKTLVCEVRESKNCKFKF